MGVTCLILCALESALQLLPILVLYSLNISIVHGFLGHNLSGNPLNFCCQVTLSSFCVPMRGVELLCQLLALLYDECQRLSQGHLVKFVLPLDLLQVFGVGPLLFSAAS